MSMLFGTTTMSTLSWLHLVPMLHDLLPMATSPGVWG